MEIQTDAAKTKHGAVLSWTIVLLLFAIAMSAFAYIRLSDNPVVFPVAFIVLTLLQLVRIIHGYSAFSRVGLTLEIVLFGVLLWGVLSSYVWDLRAHSAYLSFLLFWLLCSKLKTALGDRSR